MEKLYGSLGRKMGHSWSVPIHKALGCQSYQLFEKEPEELPAFLAREDIGGLSVTMPYKRDVMPYCDVIDSNAQAIGCVNVLCRRGDGKLYAWNTDAVGFRYTAERAGISFAGKKAVVLGSGGASLTARAMAAKLGAREVVVISRSGPDNYGNLSRHADADIVVNTTPVGMFPNAGVSAVDLAVFPACSGVLDVVYNPCRTALLMQAEELGIPCSGGLPMLVAQAVAAEEHFFEKTIPASETERILSDLRRDCTNLILIGGDGAVAAALAELTGREILTAGTQAEAAAAGMLSGKILAVGGEAARDAGIYHALHQNGRIYQLSDPCGPRPDMVVPSRQEAAETAAEIWREFCEHSGD